jgi:hypothetical protein
MVARLLQYFYLGNYDAVGLAGPLTRILETSYPEGVIDTLLTTDGFDFETHALMYAMGDRFEVTGLKTLSATRFVNELRLKEFSVADLVSAVEIVYSSTPENDIGLRKWVTYRAQHSAQELVRHPEFERVMKAHEDFAWDFATKYARANYLWCRKCQKTIDLVECRCGFNGMCGDDACTKGAVEALCCTGCRKYGKFRREIPREDDNCTLGELGRTDKPEAKPKWTPRKRRSS